MLYLQEYDTEACCYYVLSLSFLIQQLLSHICRILKAPRFFFLTNSYNQHVYLIIYYIIRCDYHNIDPIIHGVYSCDFH